MIHSESNLDTFVKSSINHWLRLRMKDKLNILLCPRHTFTHFTFNTTVKWTIWFAFNDLQSDKNCPAVLSSLRPPTPNVLAQKIQIRCPENREGFRPPGKGVWSAYRTAALAACIWHSACCHIHNYFKRRGVFFKVATIWSNLLLCSASGRALWKHQGWWQSGVFSTTKRKGQVKAVLKVFAPWAFFFFSFFPLVNVLTAFFFISNRQYCFTLKQHSRKIYQGFKNWVGPMLHKQELLQLRMWEEFKGMFHVLLQQGYKLKRHENSRSNLH